MRATEGSSIGDVIVDAGSGDRDLASPHHVCASVTVSERVGHSPPTKPCREKYRPCAVTEVTPRAR
jgi:hypothetical protein